MICGTGKMRRFVHIWAYPGIISSGGAGGEDLENCSFLGFLGKHPHDALIFVWAGMPACEYNPAANVCFL